jgi:hypothetical protein
LADDVTTVQTEPNKWIGKRLPVLDHIDVGKQLSRGEWIVMFYHAKCGQCMGVLPQFLTLAIPSPGRKSTPRVAIVELPPFENDRRELDTDQSWVHGRLDSRRHWKGLTARFIRLSNGNVTLSTDQFEELLRNVSTGESRTEDEEARLFPDYLSIRREMFLKEIACGPLAMIAIFRHFKIALDPMEVDQLLAKAGSTGIDMYNLKEIAQARGLHALGVETDITGLRRLNRPAIAHLN